MGEAMRVQVTQGDMDAANAAANEACRNMDGELDMGALGRHFASYRLAALSAPPGEDEKLVAELRALADELGKLARVDLAVARQAPADMGALAEGYKVRGEKLTAQAAAALEAADRIASGLPRGEGKTAVELLAELNSITSEQRYGPEAQHKRKLAAIERALSPQPSLPPDETLRDEIDTRS